MATKNLWAKTRPITNPYLTIAVSGWTWKVFKAYQSRKKEKTNNYARWLCAVSSPYTGGSSDMGDTYIASVPLTHEAAAILAQREKDEEVS